MHAWASTVRPEKRVRGGEAVFAAFTEAWPLKSLFDSDQIIGEMQHFFWELWEVFYKWWQNTNHAMKNFRSKWKVSDLNCI